LRQIVIILAFGAGSVAAQQPVVAGTQPYRSEQVAGCDAFSQVTRMSMKMQVAKTPLPAAEVRGAETRYRLGAGGRPGATDPAHRNVVFVYGKEPGNRLAVGLDGKEKHCFGLKPGVGYSFRKYYLTDKMLEVYGRMYWGRYYRHFRVIFYFKPPDANVLFDLDDDIKPYA
jgi:hypothetical protein